jgi:manganese-dependent inorganic pyrophosphatase
VFRSPTTTGRDKVAAEWLAELASVDIAAYGDELLRAAPGLGARTIEEILDTDRKVYTMGGHAVSLAQVEATGFGSLPSRREEILAAMEEWRQRESLAFFGLMVTDVVTGKSKMLTRGDKWIITVLPFDRSGEGEYDLEDMVSRKKQLVPALSALLDESF